MIKQNIIWRETLVPADIFLSVFSVAFRVLMSPSQSKPRIRIHVCVCVCVCILVPGPKSCPQEQRGATGHFNEHFSMERGGNEIGLELSNTVSIGSN